MLSLLHKLGGSRPAFCSDVRHRQTTSIITSSYRDEDDDRAGRRYGRGGAGRSSGRGAGRGAGGRYRDGDSDRDRYRRPVEPRQGYRDDPDQADRRGGPSRGGRDDGGADADRPGRWDRQPPPSRRFRDDDERPYDRRPGGRDGVRRGPPREPPREARRGPRGEPPARSWGQEREGEQQRGPSGYQDPFEVMHGRLSGQLQQAMEQPTVAAVIRKDTWERLLGHVRDPEQAERALALLRADAALRAAAGWDWATAGYGQTAFQLTAAAAAAGAPGVAEALLEHREELHLTLNKDLIPSLMRKVASAAAEADPRVGYGGSGDSDDDDVLAVVRRLYAAEARLRGENSPEAAYELSKALRRAGDVGGVVALAAQMRAEGLAVRDRLLEDTEKWLAKRGVQG